MSKIEDAKEFHLTVVAQARRRNAEHRDIEDFTEFENVMEVVEKLGGVCEFAAGKGMEPAVVGRALLFYARCVAAGTEGGTRGVFPEAKA